MLPARVVPPAYSPVRLRDALAAFASPSAAPELRDALQRHYGLHPLLLDSGTSALTLALLASRTPQDRPVALPAFGCFDLATALIGAGRPAVLYDVSPETLGPDWGSLRHALMAGADTVVVAHLFGVPVDLAAARALTNEFGATLIEDAAQGVGGRWADRPLGAHGDLSVLSFGRGKGLTGGGGGALLSREIDANPVLERVGALSSLKSGIALLLQELLSPPALYGLPASLPFLELGATHHREPTPPRAPTRWSARVLVSALEDVSRHTEGRRSRARYLSGAAAAAAVPTVNLATSGEPGWLRYPLVLPTDADVIAIPRALGVTRSYPIALDVLPALRGHITVPHPVTGARTLAARLVTLPTHAFVNDNDLKRLETWLHALSRPHR